MAFHLIGLGLSLTTLTEEAIHAIQNAKHIYLEGYTVNFPYGLDELDHKLGIPLETLSREEVENEKILEKAKHGDVVLLVYGDSLSATTHTQLILSCKKQGIEYKIYHNASILTAIANTGLQLYKFGKTASMPAWIKHKYEPTSFINYYKENRSIKAHTLILTDIGLDLHIALYQLEESFNKEGIDFQEKIIVISNAGTVNQKIFYEHIETLKEIQNMPKPFCMIIPSDMHFIEQEALESFKETLA